MSHLLDLRDLTFVKGGNSQYHCHIIFIALYRHVRSLHDLGWRRRCCERRDGIIDDTFFCRNLRWKLEGNTTVDESLISYNIVNIVLFVVIDLSGFLGHDQWHGLRHWTFPSR